MNTDFANPIPVPLIFWNEQPLSEQEQHPNRNCRPPFSQHLFSKKLLKVSPKGLLGCKNAP